MSLLQMRICLFIIITILPISKNQCQIPSSKYNQLETPSTFRENMKEIFDGFSLQLGYEHTYFLNPVFEQNINNVYNRDISYYLGGRLTTYPFSFDVTYFNDGYINESLPGIEVDDKIKHRGFEMKASTIIIPFAKLAALLQPKASLGYQYSQLCLHCSLTDNDPDDLRLPLAAISTSGFFGVFGLSIPIKTISIEGEVKQSINLENDFSLFQWKVGISIRPVISAN